MKHKTKPQRVNYLANESDLLVLVLARMGQHTSSIAQRTGLTPSQVQYRILHGDCKGVRREFRDGQTKEFSWAYQAIHSRIRLDERWRIKQNIKQSIAKLKKAA